MKHYDSAGGNNKESTRVPLLFVAPSDSAGSEVAQPSHGLPAQPKSSSRSKKGATRVKSLIGFKGSASWHLATYMFDVESD
ncbi:hypothetical protein L6452_38854 [Arctium lappa]|uniref:Uncharacterized protein n=1 Tax=Arctium lappa TaxID=4217 RepID=A0ACB8XRK2_ARCLA|nr:hypothetical protein L6452_38854 [Arctium lappa]